MSADEKVTCRTPNTGAGSTRIPRWKFEAVETAILAALRANGGALAFKDLAETAGSYLDDDVRSRLGSLGWHVTTVKLEMEVRGMIARIDGVSPQTITLAGKAEKP